MLELFAPLSLLEIYFYHSLISVLVALVATFLLQRRFKPQLWTAFAFILVFNLAIPLLGYLFSVWLVYYLLNVRYDKVLHDAQMINLDEFEGEFVEVNRLFGEGSMVDLMENQYAPVSLKLKALSSIADNITQKNVSIIKRTLSNSDDELRLYSFAIINGLERNLNGKINLRLKSFQKEENLLKRAAIARELAFLYWEMIYYEMTEGTLKNFLLDEVRRYIRFALEHKPYDIKLHVLLGRIYLMTGNYEAATAEFTFAIEASNEDTGHILPYLAEVYYQQGNYRSAKAILNSNEELRLNATLSPLVRQWSDVS